MLGLFCAVAAGIVALPGISASAPGSSPAVNPGDYAHFIGALHEHSGYSDGYPGSRPSDYYASAKRFGIDFLGSGEHSDNADLPVVFNEGCLSSAIPECAIADKQEPQNSLRKWAATLEQARAATTAGFTGFRGFEWSSERFGHLNVYFSKNFANAYRDGGNVSMETFWNWFLTRPERGGGSDGLGTFNHPDAKKLPVADPTKNWNDFEYVAAADDRMVGLEVYNGGKDFANDGWYDRALDKGWHVGAIGAEDKGHDPGDKWGSPEHPKTVVIARDRSEAALREAMLARRFYAVRDNDVRIEMSAGGRPMGSRIGAPLGATVPITATVTPGAARLELITAGGAIAASSAGSSISFDAPVTAAERRYYLRVIGADGKASAYSSPVWVRAGGDHPPMGEWVAGDLHVHTPYSHDSYGGPGDDNTGPEEAHLLGNTVQGNFESAARRGLDYLAITDHNDVRSQSDPGFGAAGVLPVAGYENSLSGHAQMLGAHRVYPKVSGNSAPAVQGLADELRVDGGVFQINHPAEGATDYPHELDWSLRYQVAPDTVEVWNISRIYQPPFPSASSNDDGVRYWEGWLDRGERVAATGGSDSHYIWTSNSLLGSPTTWVYVTERSERGILEGIRAGRTTISHQPPALQGPRVFLEGDDDGDGVFESMLGDTVRPRSKLRARVEGAPGSFLRVVTDEGREAFEPILVSSPGFEHEFRLPKESTWVRAEIVHPDGAEQRATACDGTFGGQTTYCRNQLAVLGMTSALYLREPPVATQLSLTAPSSGVHGTSVSVSSTLTASGLPVPDRSIEFSLGASTQTVTTNADGIAQATFLLDQPSGTYDLRAVWAGDESYLPSSATASFTITPKYKKVRKYPPPT